MEQQCYQCGGRNALFDMRNLRVSVDAGAVSIQAACLSCHQDQCQQGRWPDASSSARLSGVWGLTPERDRFYGERLRLSSRTTGRLIIKMPTKNAETDDC